MTRRASARLAGFLFLFYIVNALAGSVLYGQAVRGTIGPVATLAALAGHAALVRWSAVLTLLTCFDAIALGLALYGLTRDEDHELALLALCCRVAEGVVAAVATVRILTLLSVATTSVEADPAAPAAQALGALMLRSGGQFTLVGSTCFAVGSTIFAWLFLRARTIPAWLAWTGLVGSLLIAVGLPLQIAGLLHGLAASLQWIPVAVFEVVLGVWLLVKGTAPPRPRAVPTEAAP